MTMIRGGKSTCAGSIDGQGESAETVSAAFTDLNSDDHDAVT
jgi:hypothetical protein